MDNARLDVGSPLNAISASPDGSHVIIVGREIMKVISIKDSLLKHVQNLRVSKVKQNLNATGSDCVWHPLESFKHTIATAAVNGAVVIWNIINQGQSKQERVINDHTRAVNRLSWHPISGELLLSGSQDGTMKLWDFRDPSQNCCKQTFNGKAESVRDVQFSPSFPNYFAAAFDNGTVQMWDIRTGAAFRKITAHQGLVLSVDWHPEDKSVLASGGRDRTVKVWDLNAKGSSPIHSIQTIQSVSRIKWRPGHKYHIASCSGSIDNYVHIWDIRKSYIPVASIKEHTDVVTGILWTSKYNVLTCGKDGMLMSHDTSNAVRPVATFRTTAISWTVNNEVSIANDPVMRADVHDLSPNTLPPVDPSVRDTSAGFVKVFAALGMFRELGPSMDSTVFQYLAENYRIPRKGEEMSSSELCDHNARIAAHVRQFQISQTWQIIKLFYEPLELAPNEEDNELETLSGGMTMEVPTPTDALDNFSLADDVTTVEASSGLRNDINDNAYSLSNEAVFPLSPLPSNSSSSLLADEPNPILPLPTLFSPAVRSTSAGHNELKSFKTMDDTLISKNFGSLPSSGTNTPLISRPATPTKTHTQHQQVTSNDTTLEKTPMWEFESVIHDLLAFYAERGDVQSCVAMCMVLRSKLEVAEELLLKWFSSYIDLLQRHQLWTIANLHIKESQLISISVLNQQSTTIHTSCPHCTKPLYAQGWACETCRMLTAKCSVCRQPVKGMYVWCQGCGHGGHLAHMREWFLVKQQKMCPSGCAHYCVFKAHTFR